jgi:hypothetical protein
MMSTRPDIDNLVNRFRLASRDLFNVYFHVNDPYKNDGWSAAERFSEVEVVLFEKLVLEAGHLSNVKYGTLHPEIQVALRGTDHAPIMLNRDVDSGYWDYPVKEVTQDAKLLFVRFFDWDQLDYRDNRYVRVRVDQWPSHPETVGKHALINSQSVRFEKA